MEKKEKLLAVENELGLSACEYADVKHVLTREQQKSAHYQMQVDTSRQATQNTERKKSFELHNHKANIGNVRNGAIHAQQEVLLPEVKVGGLDEEKPLQNIKLEQVTVERVELCKQVDTLRKELANLERDFNRERINSSMLQSKVEELEEELHIKTDQLLHSFSKQNELDMELASVRNDQQAVLENAAKLESDLLLSHNELKSAKVELLHFQEMSKKLQNSVVAAQRETEVSRKELETEKNSFSTMEVSMKNIKCQLEIASQKVKINHQHLADREDTIKNLKEEMNSLCKSNKELVSDLQVRISELEMEKKKLKEAFEDLEINTSELNSTQVQMEKLQCTLVCEMEKNSNLQIDLSVAESDLNSLGQKCISLNDELVQCKQQHKEIVEAQSSLINKLESEVMTAEVQNKNSCQEIESLNDNLKKEKEMSSSLLSKLQLSEGALLTMKEKMQCTVKELSSKAIDKECLESTVAMLEGRNQELCEQLNEAQCELDECKTQVDNAKSELSLTVLQLGNTTERLQVYKNDLESEREEKLQLQVDLKSSESVTASLHQNINDLEQKLITEEDKTKSLTADLLQSDAIVKELSKNLRETQQELIIQRESAEAARDNHSQVIDAIMEENEETISLLRQEKTSLEGDLGKTREKLLLVQEHLKVCETEASECTTKFSLLEQKYLHMEKEFESKTNMYKTLESHSIRLESDNTEASLLLSDLNDKISVQSILIEQLKNDLDRSQHERDSLHDQIQLQRETATSSHNRMQKHNLEKSAELYKTIQEQTGKLNEALVASKSLKKEAASLKVENHSLTLTICEKEESLSLLRDQLREENTRLKISQQKVAQLESVFQKEQESNNKLQESLSEEHTKKVEYEAVKCEKEKQLQCVSQELHQYKNLLAKEKTFAEKLRGDFNMLQTKHATTEAQLEATRESLRDCKLKTEQEVSSLRQKCHTERRSLKDKVRELHTHLQTVKAQYDSRGDEISKLEASNKLLVNDQQELSRKFAETKVLLFNKSDECKNMELKVKSLDFQMAQLLKELTTLRKVVHEVEDHKKKIEARSQSDLKHILAEVTEHMEQQYSNQRYLDKLRADNEAVAMLERERKISHLRNELKLKKQEVRQDRLCIDRLTTESKHLRNKQKEQESSRRRLETRLERVNDTLCHTSPSPSTNQLGSLSYSSHPLLCSTPKKLK